MLYVAILLRVITKNDNTLIFLFIIVISVEFSPFW